MNQMHRYVHNTFWVDNEVSFTFAPLLFGPEEERNTRLNLRDFAAFLNDYGFTLPGADGPDSADQRALVKQAAQTATPAFPVFYEFPDPETVLPDGTTNLLVSAFFQFEAQPADSQVTAPASHQVQPMGQSGVDLSLTPVARLVNLVNEHLQALSSGKAKLRDGTPLKPIPILAAAPHWYCGASNGDRPITTGCPLTPPFPVPADATCASSSGLWPIQLPDLPHELKEMTGDGVTVFVLDSLPSENDIKRAAEAAGEHNLLLLDLNNNVTFTYPALPEILDRPGPQQTMTGKDIKGRAVGFRMPDHGLFVAGIIRDIAPNARVECIRVLNDFCAGTAQILTGQLHRILDRIRSGDLQGRDVVINMSLVIPDDEDVQTSGIDLALARLNLRTAIQSLSERGVIFVASAGNEGDRRYMLPKGEHPDALYPAAYAYPLGEGAQGVDNMIPVGAVNHKGEVTSYSCDPGERGVSTYGGEVPASFTNEATHMTEGDTRTIDAVIGVYTQLSYPALSIDDPEATYPVPNAHGWAYWIGTSFATPVISAVMARALELQRRTSSPRFEKPITASIIKCARQPGNVSGLGGSGGSSTGIDRPWIRACQCQPKKNGFLGHLSRGGH